MIVDIYCPFCDAKVTAGTLLGDTELDGVLENDGDVEVIHVSEGKRNHSNTRFSYRRLWAFQKSTGVMLLAG
jgi:hypothetical protein